MVKPLTVIGLALPLAVMPSGAEVTVYAVMGKPPLLSGALNETVAVALTALTPAMLGAVGGPVGVTPVHGADAAPVPALLVAVTVKE